MKNVMDLRVCDIILQKNMKKTRPPREIVNINLWSFFLRIATWPKTYEFFLMKFKIAANFVRRTAGASRSQPTGCFVTFGTAPNWLAGLEWLALAGVLGWHAMVASSNCMEPVSSVPWFSQPLKLPKVQSICRRSLHAQCLVLSCVQMLDVSHVSLDGIGTHGLISPRSARMHTPLVHLLGTWDGTNVARLIGSGISAFKAFGLQWLVPCLSPCLRKCGGPVGNLRM